MKVKELRQLLKNLPDENEVRIKTLKGKNQNSVGIKKLIDFTLCSEFIPDIVLRQTEKTI